LAEENQTTAHEQSSGHAESHVDPWMGIIFPYINFSIFLALLIYFARKPAAEAARKRREDFERLMAEATKAKEVAEERLRELTARQAQLDAEVKEIQTTSRVAAEAEAAKIVADAERLAVHFKAEARRIAEAEVLRARQELRQEIVAAVKDSVTQKIKSELTPEAQLTLVKRQVGELRSVKTEG
jgi:F-type H+-transporting ATPase subunit b